MLLCGVRRLLEESAATCEPSRTQMSSPVDSSGPGQQQTDALTILSDTELRFLLQKNYGRFIRPQPRIDMGQDEPARNPARKMACSKSGKFHPQRNCLRACSIIEVPSQNFSLASDPEPIRRLGLPTSVQSPTTIREFALTMLPFTGAASSRPRDAAR